MNRYIYITFTGNGQYSGQNFSGVATANNMMGSTEISFNGISGTVDKDLDYLAGQQRVALLSRPNYDTIGWINFQNWTTTPSGGSAKKASSERIMVGGKPKVVYVGSRGGKYIKKNGKYVSVKTL